ncbi:IclR family transcriptional regulator [Afifella sp. IM 167]|uniref:IclR family transcriptional regulator n=1 Tax=Afifella sp. IM 167 TaxID=2033586 RepID=UPI001CCF1AA0|nr:IclR family transcriptional regulator [Afifella sp. IM 167]MBZ8132397.1 IclR family transcriptional regulator [Afifella sp. IM 167]
MPSSSSLNVKSVEKAFVVLGAFSGRSRFLSLGDIAEATGLDKSAVQRFTRTLTTLGYLEQDKATRHYCLGRRVLDLSYEYLRSNTLIERAAPILVDLRRAVRERVDLTLPDGEDVLYVFRLQSKRETLHAALIGRRVPLYCSAGGRAILSCLPQEEAQAAIVRACLRKVTPRTLTDPEQIMAEIDKARRTGFAFQAEEWRLGELVVAAPIVDREGRPVAAIHVAGSTAEWDPAEFADRMGPQVVAAAQDVRG